MTHNDKSSKDDELSWTMKLKDAQWTLFHQIHTPIYSHFFHLEVWEYREIETMDFVECCNMCCFATRCESSADLQSRLRFDDRHCYSGPKLLAAIWWSPLLLRSETSSSHVALFIWISRLLAHLHFNSNTLVLSSCGQLSFCIRLLFFLYLLVRHNSTKFILS